MNPSLELLAQDVGLLQAGNERMRLAFCYACTARIRHLLEEPEVIGCLDTLGRYLQGDAPRDELELAQKEAERLANHHRGSKSIDGCGHAAVSASYAVANAVNGKALQAADYVVYATVYAGGGYGVVAQRQAFEPEFAWQVWALRQLCAGVKAANSVN